jgi:hypothetical protein
MAHQAAVIQPLGLTDGSGKISPRLNLEDPREAGGIRGSQNLRQARHSVAEGRPWQAQGLFDEGGLSGPFRHSRRLNAEGGRRRDPKAQKGRKGVAQGHGADRFHGVKGDTGLLPCLAIPMTETNLTHGWKWRD